MAFCLAVLFALFLELAICKWHKADVVTEFLLSVLDRFMRVPRTLEIVLLAASLGASQAVIAHAAHLLAVRSQVVALLPIPVAYIGPPTVKHAFDVPIADRIAFAAIATVQAGILTLLFAQCRKNKWRQVDTWTTIVASAFCAAIAIGCSATTSSDFYAYVGYSLLGASASYAPPPTPFTGTYSIINSFWGRPLIPAAYGPLWLLWNSAILKLGSSLYAKLIVLRVINVVAITGVVIALRLLRVAPQYIAGFAVNPAVWLYYVTTAHNDVLAIALVVAALYIARRYPTLAGALAGIGASVKISILVAAGSIVIQIGSRRNQIIYISSLILTSFCAGPLLGGERYLHALSAVGRIYGPAKNSSFHGLLGVVHVALAVTVLALVGVAIYSRRQLRSVPLGITSMGAALYPWYAIWGLPLALTEEKLIPVFLACLPLATAMLESEMSTPVLGLIVDAVLLLALARTWTRRRSIAAVLPS